MAQIDQDAEKIAKVIAEGDLNKANDMWKELGRKLKLYEMMILKDKIHAKVAELERETANA